MNYMYKHIDCAGKETGRTLWGVVGLGAFGFNRQPVPEGRKIITTTRSHMQQSVQVIYLVIEVLL